MAAIAGDPRARRGISAVRIPFQGDPVVPISPAVVLLQRLAFRREQKDAGSRVVMAAIAGDPRARGDNTHPVSCK